MTVWDLATIAQVERLYVEVDVGLEVEHGPGAQDAIASRLASVLKQEAHALAVEIHPDDVHVQRGDEDGLHNTVRYVGWWRPTTRTSRLLGGARDGTTYETTLDRWTPLRVATPTLPLVSSDAVDDASRTADVAFEVDLYEVVGWSEDGRYWLRATRSHAAT